MTSTTDTDREHPDVAEISDLTEGLLSAVPHRGRAPAPRRVRALRRRLASLEEIRGLLGTLPGPHRMPADVAGRIDAALAAEACSMPRRPSGRCFT